MEKREYTLRALQAKDLFMMMRILKKIGLKEVKECFNAAEVKKEISEAAGKEDGERAAAIGLAVTMEMAALLIDHLPECENEIYAFLASLSGQKAEEIAELPMNTFAGMIADVFKDEGFADFFSRLFGSPKTGTSDSST